MLKTLFEILNNIYKTHKIFLKTENATLIPADTSLVIGHHAQQYAEVKGREHEVELILAVFQARSREITNVEL